MPRPRTCPFCLVVIEIDKGYRFDDQNNLICDCCGKIAFAMTWAAEDAIEIAVRSRTATSKNYVVNKETYEENEAYAGLYGGAASPVKHQQPIPSYQNRRTQQQETWRTPTPSTPTQTGKDNLSCIPGVPPAGCF